MTFGQRSEVSPGRKMAILVACSCAHIIIFGTVYTSGVWYMMFHSVFKESSWKLSLISTLPFGVHLMIGPVSATLVNWIGFRNTMCVGGCLAAVGYLVSAFSPTSTMLAFTFGIIAGSGIGIAYVPAISILGIYFTKLRAVAFAIASLCGGVGIFIYPLVVIKLENYYGWRGTLMFVSGFALNLCLCGMIFPSDAYPDIQPEAQIEKPTFKEKLKSMVKSELLLDINFLVVALNNFMGVFGLALISVHLPQFTVERGISPANAAMLVSISGITSCMGKLATGLMLQTKKISPFVIYGTVMLISGIFTCICPLLSRLWEFILYACIFGSCLNAAFGPALLEIIVAVVQKVELLPSGWGYALIPQALGSFVGPPIAGWLYDETRTYPISFYLGGGILIIGALVMVIPFVRLRSAHKWKYQVSSTEDDILKVEISCDLKSHSMDYKEPIMCEKT